MTVLSKMILAGAVSFAGVHGKDVKDAALDALVKKMPHSKTSVAGKTAKDCPFAAKLHRKALLAAETDAEKKALIEARLERNEAGTTSGNKLRGRSLQSDGRLYLSDYMTCPNE